MTSGGPLDPTAAQRRVIAHRPGSALRVAAAAGSGKTGTMAALFAARLADQVSPQRLMAVTFTEKAATELRERIALEVTAPLDQAAAARELLRLERAWVGTFHQLALRLLREHPYRAGVSPGLQLLDEVGEGVTRGDAVAALLAGRPPGPGLLPYDPDEWAELESLDRWGRAAYGAMRQARARERDPQVVRARAAGVLAGWEAAGHPQAELGAHRQALEMLVALWTGYEARLAAAGATDFDGLLRLALGAVAPGSRLQGWCRRHFDTIIVDEFQDTSELQVQLLEAVARPGWANVVAVGDPRQAIYGWRDAAPEVMDRVPGEEVPLDRNHRSLAPIVIAAERLIRADPAFADLAPVTLHRDQPAVPVLLGAAADAATEAEAIASVLRIVHARGLAHGDARIPPLAFGDCAVLAYTLTRLQGPLEEALRRHGIAYRAGGGALFERPEVQDLVALLRAAADPEDDAAWLRCLQGPVQRVPDAVVLRLGPPDLPLHVRLRRAVAADMVAAPWRDRVVSALAQVDRLAELARHQPAAGVVGAALEVSGLLRRHETRARLGDADGRRAVAALREVQRLCLTAEQSGRVAGLRHLLQRLDALAADDRTAEPPPTGDDDAVTLLTVHRAKGLEFPLVVLADVRPFHTPSAPAVIWDRADGGVFVSRLAEAPTQAASAWRQSAALPAERAERRRVWYVGMTRARDALLVTTTVRGRGPAAGAATPEAMAERMAAGDAGPGDDDFLLLATAIGAGDGAIRPWPQFPEAPIAEAAQLGPVAGAPEPVGAAAAPEPAWLAGRWMAVEALEAATAGGGERPPPAASALSFTGLSEVHRCPRRAGYRRLRLPPTDPETSAAAEVGGGDRPAGGGAGGVALGVAVHRVLEAVHRAAPGRAPRAEECAQALTPWGALLGPDAVKTAADLLAAYRRLETAAWPTLGVEVDFCWRPIGAQGPLTIDGTIDRVARDPSGTVWILDYKTGLLPAAELGTAAHQLRLYAMAWGDGLGRGVAAPLRAAALDLRRPRLVEVGLDAVDLAATRSWIAAAAARVGSGDLSVGDAYPERPCAGCAYRSGCPERRPDVAAPVALG